MSEKLVFAVPKGRILDELLPLFKKADLIPEDAFFDDSSRLLRFRTNHENVELIRVRSFDVASFVAFGAAQIGVCGSDVLAEFNYSDLYAPVDLGVGKCHMSVACPKGFDDAGELYRSGHVRVATKYPEITKRYYASLGVQAECVKLSGAMELAPVVNLCKRILDVVSTGATLRANGLEERQRVMEVSSKLIMNRGAFKVRPNEMAYWTETFKKVCEKC